MASRPVENRPPRTRSPRASSRVTGITVQDSPIYGRRRLFLWKSTRPAQRRWRRAGLVDHPLHRTDRRPTAVDQDVVEDEVFDGVAITVKPIHWSLVIWASSDSLPEVSIVRISSVPKPLLMASTEV